MQNGECLSDLVVQCVGGLQEVEQLSVVHLEQHTGDLAGKLGVSPVE